MKNGTHSDVRDGEYESVIGISGKKTKWRNQNGGRFFNNSYILICLLINLLFIYYVLIFDRT